MTDDLRKDRAMGAIMGTLIGDSLGMGCHWYYDIEAQVRDYGDWISDYHDCKPERRDVHGKVATLRHEQGVRAGDVSQTGQFVVMLMESIAEKGTYDEADYTARLDEFLKTIDGTPFSGRYTDRAIVDVWHNRKAGIPWSDAGSMTDTPEAAVRAVVIAARSSGDPVALAIEGESNIHLTHKNPYITGSSLAYAMATEGFIQGVPLSGIRKYMSALKDNPETRDRTCSNDVRFQVGNEGAVHVDEGRVILVRLDEALAPQRPLPPLVAFAVSAHIIPRGTEAQVQFGVIPFVVLGQAVRGNSGEFLAVIQLVAQGGMPIPFAPPQMRPCSQHVVARLLGAAVAYDACRVVA